MQPAKDNSSIDTAVEPSTSAAQPTCCHHRSLFAGSPYPTSAPFRCVYLTARILTIVCCLVIFPLSFVAERVINRGEWMTPMLNPSIWVACRSGWEVYVIIHCSWRQHALVRLFYDGILAAGLAVSSGFLVHFTLGDLTGSVADASSTTAGVAGATLFFMFSDLLLELGISMNGLMEWLEGRRCRGHGYGAAV